MMNENKFTDELKKVFEYIQNTLLKEYETDRISSEYFVLAVMMNEFSVGYKVMSKIMLNETLEKAKVYYFQRLSMHTKSSVGIKHYDDMFEKCVNNARLLAAKQKSKEINSGHILFSVLTMNLEMNRYFKTLGVTLSQVGSQVFEETRSIIE